MSNHLIELLTTNIKTKNKPDIKPTQNFILEILKEIEPKKAIDLLKDLNLDNEEIKKLILKLSPKKQQFFLDLLKEKNIKQNLKTDKKELKIDNLIQLIIKENSKTNLFPDIKDNNLPVKSPIIKKTNSKLENNQITDQNNKENFIVNNILNFLINSKNASPEIKKEIKNIKQHITELIKKEIEANTKIENKLLTKKVITKIKNAGSFEELISIANKNGLNIKKIITKIVKKTKPQIDNSFLKLKTVIPLKHFQTKNKIITTLKTSKKDNKNILQTLLSNKIPNTPTINIENNKINVTNNEVLKTNLKNNENENILFNIYNPNNEIKHKIIEAKESIRHFSNNLKHAIENYKPPISKLSIELHPKELGKVDITIIHRGDNLQININSNNNAINFFHSHQTELRNALVNMGYSGIDMSFNSNQNKENQQKKAYKQYSSEKNDENYEELIIDIPYKYA
jgi:flagellar hook-length control protein FliK